MTGPNAGSPEEGVAYPIANRPGEMTGAIYFHHEACRFPKEVGEVRPQRLLAAKFRAVETAAAQERPQSSFGGRRRSAQSASPKGRGAAKSGHMFFIDTTSAQVVWVRPAPLSLRERGWG